MSKDRPLHDSKVFEPAPSLSAELRGLTRGRRVLIFWQVVVSFIEGGFEAAILTLFARLALRAVDAENEAVFVPGIGERSLAFSIIVLVVLIFGRLGAGLLNTFLSSRFQFSLVRRLRNESLDAYVSSSWLGQSKLDDGTVQQLLVSVPNGVSSQISNLTNHVGNIAIMVSMLGYSMFTDAGLTSILIFVIVSSTILFRPLRALIKRTSTRVVAYQKRLASAVAQFSSIRFEAQAFGLMEASSEPLRAAVESEAYQSEHLGRLKGSVVPIFTMVTYLAVALSILIIVNTGSENLATTGPILLVVLRSLSYGTAVQQAAAGLASLGPPLDFLRTQKDDLRNNQIVWGKRSLESLESFSLEGVTFAYPGAEVSAIEGAFLKVSNGMRVGIVGPSGGGKSTVVRLTLGLLQPQEGKVLVNDVPLHDYDRASWGSQIGIVPQSAQLISGSIAANLRFFRDGISEDDLWASLKIADLHDEVSSMPEGLATVIGPGRRALSGGQQQRLAIARAFASRPTLVVMDEPTSSIDGISETTISDSIGRMPDHVTVLIVSHRPKILEGCDVLVTVEGGKITAVGEPDSLMSSSSYLRSLDWTKRS